MRLALACGRADVDGFLEELSSRQVAEWQAFEQVAGPIGTRRDDVLAGVVASTIANVNRDPKKRARPFTADDMIRWDRTPRASTDTLRAKVRAINRALGGTETTKG